MQNMWVWESRVYWYNRKKANDKRNAGGCKRTSEKVFSCRYSAHALRRIATHGIESRVCTYVPISACCIENSNMVHRRLSTTNDDADDYYSDMIDTSDIRRNIGEGGGGILRESRRVAPIDRLIISLIIRALSGTRISKTKILWCRSQVNISVVVTCKYIFMYLWGSYGNKGKVIARLKKMPLRLHDFTEI